MKGVANKAKMSQLNSKIRPQNGSEKKNPRIGLASIVILI